MAIDNYHLREYSAYIKDILFLKSQGAVREEIVDYLDEVYGLQIRTTTVSEIYKALREHEPSLLHEDGATLPIRTISYTTDVFSAQWEIMNQFIGREIKKNVGIKGLTKQLASRNVLVCGDTHIPFQSQAAVEYMLSYPMPAPDIIVINGDLLDMHAASRFIKYREVPINVELAGGMAFLEMVLTKYPDTEIYLIDGNHLDRIVKLLASQLPTELLNSPLFTRPLQFIVNGLAEEGYKNIHYVNTTYNFGDSEEDITAFKIVGDAVIGHVNSASAIQLRGVEKFYQWLQNWNHIIPGTKDIRLVVQGHSHKVGMFKRGETTLVESGCLCGVQGYAVSQGDIKYSPGQPGFVYFTQHKNDKTERYETDLTTLQVVDIEGDKTYVSEKTTLASSLEDVVV